LGRIRAGREALVKAGKIKRDKGDSAIIGSDDNRYYQKLPQGWASYRLGDCWELLSGRDLIPSEYSDKPNGIPYITGASNFENGELVINRWTSAPKVIAIKGDLLVTCKGTVGEMLICYQDKCHIARQIMAIRNKNNLSIDFLCYTLLSHIQKIAKVARGIIPGISRDDLLDLTLPLPPLAEQHRIIEVIEKGFEHLDNINKNLLSNSL
jgi:type I restriction enzyme S subunit